MVSRWPGLAGMDANDVLARLMSLKVRASSFVFFLLECHSRCAIREYAK